ncbi:MAG: copper transporter [Actinobacteria bacterium]|nr:copper transporter [Actinomycetota bacterium]
MINFRFHLASLIAVFLALAIGIVMGSTVVKEATVKGLRAEIHRVERSSNARARQNSALEGQVGDLENYVRESMPHIVLGSLSGVDVAIVAVRGVDGVVARATADLVQQAGGANAGVLWLENSWSLKNPDDARRLGAMLGEPDAPVKKIRDDALVALGTRLAGTAATARASGPPVTSGGTGGDMLSELMSAGFATFETVGQHAADPFTATAYPTLGARLLVVNATDASSDQQALVGQLAHALAGAKAPTVVANVYHDERGKPSRGAGVSAITDDSTLSKEISTVDDLDLTEGQVASVLALADLGRHVGHYGYGDGATAVVPGVAQP